VAKHVIQHLINSTPGSILKPAQLDQWANYLTELFPEEDKKCYFFSVGAEVSSTTPRQSFGSHQLPSKGRRYYGCLWDNWNNERKKLRQNGIITYVKKNSRKNKDASATDSQETNSQDGQFSKFKFHSCKV
jgi:hypothetical protein